MIIYTFLHFNALTNAFDLICKCMTQAFKPVSFTERKNNGEN